MALGAERTAALEAAVDAAMQSLAQLGADLEAAREELHRLWAFRALAGMTNQDLADPAAVAGATGPLGTSRATGLDAAAS